jgi:nucleoside-diphosphate-sugar epimerase
VFNLGTGAEVTVRELARQIILLIGRRVKIEADQVRLRPEKSEVQRLLSDNRKALRQLGWAPQVNLTQGLTKTIEWIKNNLGRYRPEAYQV